MVSERVTWMVLSTLALVAPVTAASGTPDGARRIDRYGDLPLAFEENRGQVDPRTDFLARGGGYTLLLSPTEAIFALRPGGELDTAATADVTLRFEDANQTARAGGVDPLAGHVNYYLGNDPARWRTGVPTYARVQYEDVYPGIDLVYYGNPQLLEYDLIVAPGAPPESVRISLRGAARVELTESGDLVAHTAAGDVLNRAPRAYQEVDGRQQTVDARYVRAEGDSFGVRLAVYDESRPLVIDPVVEYSTYLGGSGTEIGHSIAVDPAGNVWILGGVANTPDFPGAPGPSGANDVFVSKINAAGTAVLFTTFIGGSGLEFGAQEPELTVDQSGNAYYVGGTTSSDFPTTLGAFQTVLEGVGDAVVVKLDPSGAIVYSTLLGGPAGTGNDGGDQARGVAVDDAGHAYVVGDTRSLSFPTKNPFQANRRELRSAFVAKLTPDGSDLVFSTYLGGTWATSGRGVAVDANQSAYVVGVTRAPDFPTTPGAFLPSKVGLTNVGDAFVTKFDPTGATLAYSTYLGGSLNETDSANWDVLVDVDATGHAYVAGATASIDFPITSGAVQPSAGGGRTDGFVAKLTPSGSALVFSTYLGGSGTDVPFGLAVDAAGNTHVAGSTQSPNFPTVDPVQPGFGGATDAFVSTLSPDGSSLVFSTFLGGSLSERAAGLSLDASANVYITGPVAAGFPTTSNAIQPSASPGQNAFIVKFGDVVQLGPTADAGADQSVNEGTQGVVLDGTASTGQGLSFQWAQIAGLPVVSLGLPNAVSPNFDAPFVGADTTLTFELTVTDAQLQTSSDTVDVTLVSVNDPPVADAGDDTTIKEGATAFLDGTNSFDPESDTPLFFTWTQTAGTAVALTGATSATPSFTAPVAAGDTLVFELVVSDGNESSAPDSVQIGVVLNSAPVAAAGVDQTRNEGSSITLDGSLSSDPDSDGLSFQWTQTGGTPVALDNPTSATPGFSAPFVSPGGEALVFGLVVTDDDPVNPLASVPDGVTINVVNINDPPRCDLAVPSQSMLWPPNHKMRLIQINGVIDTDLNINEVALTITGVTQDEPVNGLGDGDTSPDAVIQGGVTLEDTVLLRAERAGGGNGRVYVVSFSASDGLEGCTAAVTVTVPKSRKSVAVDDGQTVDSTQP